MRVSIVKDSNGKVCYRCFCGILHPDVHYIEEHLKLAHNVAIKDTVEHVEAIVMLEIAADISKHLEYAFTYNGRPCFHCRLCKCGPWDDSKWIKEHFEILGMDEVGHRRQYRKFLEECGAASTVRPRGK